MDGREQKFERESRMRDSFCVVDEGGDWLVVDKPAGLLAHPTRPDGTPTLWEGLRGLLAYEVANGASVSIITRLDRETSGLVLVAKSATRARALGLAMQRGEIGKGYYAIVRGVPEWDRREINAPILRQGEVMESAIWLKRCVHPQGVEAATAVEVAERIERRGERFALILARPRTGRTHQIRVHLAHVGHPLVGDKIYGGREGAYLDFIETGWTSALESELILSRHALHACELEFFDGVGIRTVRSDLPKDMREFVEGSDRLGACDGREIKR